MPTAEDVDIVVHNGISEQVILVNVEASTFDEGSEPENAIDKTVETEYFSLNDVDDFWKADFKGGLPMFVTKVRILGARANYFGGERIKSAKIEIDDQYCGSIPDNAVGGVWYDVECERPLIGTSVKVTDTTTIEDDVLAFDEIEVFAGPPILILDNSSDCLGSAKITFNADNTV